MIETAAGFRRACAGIRAAGAGLGLVPTMGALHAGHLSLVERAVSECERVAITVFVNPLQFGPDEGLAEYPRDRDRDLRIAREAGADLLFVPPERQMYPGGEPAVTVDPGPLGRRLEGASRPGHFAGVLTVVEKLFGLAGECRAYFGQKDAQQVRLVRQMVDDLNSPVRVVGCPTVREPDGLALSSRNRRLSRPERAAAVCLSRGLFAARAMGARGERDAARLAGAVAGAVRAEPLARLDYAAVVDEETWEEPGELTGPSRALVASWLGRTRLIDNVVLPWAEGADRPPGRAE